MKKKFIWLFGENESRTMNNNSFFFWDHVVLREDDVEKYFIAEKTPENVAVVQTMEPLKQKFVIWKNSIQHLQLYRVQDMGFVSLSYKDIAPSKLLWKQVNPRVTRPIVYLQHGTIAIKRLQYNGHSYNNNMFRFVVYNPQIIEKFIKENHFQPYQIYYGMFHPRYKQLVRIAKEKKDSNGKTFLWFLTWREYLGENQETEKLLRQIRSVLRNKELAEYLQRTGSKLRLCVHQFFDESKLSFSGKHRLADCFELVKTQDMDVMREIATCDVLITDYSSVGFDAAFLQKPVILFQPDLSAYMKQRDFYCTMDELKKASVRTQQELVRVIVNEAYRDNAFFRKRLPPIIDYAKIEAGAHIDRMYCEFLSIQRNKITFVGYNFFGIGGTVSATKALAEGLLEKNYMVELLSLKRLTNGKPSFPCGLNMRSLYVPRSKRLRELIKRVLYIPRWYGYLKYDVNKKYLKPYAGHALKRFMKNTKSRTVISTRESIHFFLHDAQSPNIQNKLYFFHTDAKVLRESGDGLIERLAVRELETALFVTEANRQNYALDFNFHNYKQYVIVGNCLEAERISPPETIQAVEKKDLYEGVILMRLSKDRAKDVDNIVEYGKYLKARDCRDIQIRVYGRGDYLNEFLSMLEQHALQEILLYCGDVNNPKPVICSSDFLLDLSENQSFGMIYLETVFNGKMPFCRRNIGSGEVLKDIPKCYFENFDELTQKIYALPEIDTEELRGNYKLLAARYSREAVSEKILEVIH